MCKNYIKNSSHPRVVVVLGKYDNQLGLLKHTVVSKYETIYVVQLHGHSREIVIDKEDFIIPEEQYLYYYESTHCGRQNTLVIGRRIKS